MGRAKQAWHEDQENLAMAAGYLVQWGVLKSCEIHGYMHDGDGDLQKAYRFGNAGIKRGTITLPSGMTRREFSDLLKRAYEENSGMDSCYGCDKNAADD